MSRTITITNASGQQKTYSGQVIEDGETYTLDDNEYVLFKIDSTLFADVSSGDAVIGNGTTDFSNPVEGWAWLQNDISQVSITNSVNTALNKLAVHSSSKPEPEGVDTYAVWTGAGDCPYAGSPPVPGNFRPIEDSLGCGPLLQFQMVPGTPSVTRDIHFDPRHGRVWIHEAYIKFNGAGNGDEITADVIAPATPLQQVADLDYNVVNGWLVYAGPGAGTHGLAGQPVLVKRSFSKDGDWDFDGTNLLPNMAGEGEYKITTTERIVHRYINRVPLYGDTNTYFTLSSDESAELPVELGYFLRITITNGSNDVWNLSALMEIFRERTYVP